MLSLSKDFSRIELEQACEFIIQTKQMPSVRKVKDQLSEHRKHPPAHDAVTATGVSTVPLAKDTRRTSSPETGKDVVDNPNVRGIGAFVFKEVD